MLLTDVHRSFQLSSELLALLKVAHELLRQEITLTGMDVALSSTVKLVLTLRGGRLSMERWKPEMGKALFAFTRSLQQLTEALAPE